MLQDSEIFEWVLIKHPQKYLQQQQQNAVPRGKNVNIYIFGFIQIWSMYRGKEVVEGCFLAESAAIFGLHLQIKNACRSGVY